METIEGSAPAKDGVVCFTRLYLSVTEGVDAELSTQTFDDATFLAALDVNFANLYLGALSTFGSDRSAVAGAWTPLFEARAQHGIAPLQFALAGMNAHINRDLPVALVATCQANGMDLSLISPEHHDFELVNRLLADVEQALKGTFLTGWVATVDRVVHRLGGVDDIAAMWSIERARDAAWANARALWALQPEPKLAADYLDALDGMVELTSRGLLSPASGLIERVARGAARLFAVRRLRLP
jgi:hypothetical protein